jgi:hypothetical protein
LKDNTEARVQGLINDAGFVQPTVVRRTTMFLVLRAAHFTGLAPMPTATA